MRIDSISKTFYSNNFFKKESKKVINDISFDLVKGDILGVTGPNGAGKTTLFKIILDLIEPSHGEIFIDNRESSYIAYINTNSRSFHWRLSARENLTFYGALLNLNRQEVNSKIEDLSTKFNVTNILDIPFMKLSSGQMQTFLIIRSLLKKPNYLIFDEATSSMDVEKSNNALNIIKKFIKKNNIPTIWCSHNLEEIEFMCNKFSILKNGNFKNLSKNEFKDFKRKASSYFFEIYKTDFEKIINKKKVEILNEFKSSYHIKFTDDSISINDCIKFLIELEIDIVDIVNNKSTEHFSYE